MMPKGDDQEAICRRYRNISSGERSWVQIPSGPYQVMDDIYFMQLAVEEAMKCVPSGTAFSVGALIARGDKILSTGYSRELPGNTHAEECAIGKARDLDLEGCTIYTSLEPCHPRKSGKKSCTDRIIEARIGRVVIGSYEPPIFVECKGRERLGQAKIEVCYVRDFEQQVQELNSHLKAL